MLNATAARSTPLEPVSHRSLKDVLIEDAGYTPLEDWAWQGYRLAILAFAKEYNLKRLMEMGTGGGGFFSSHPDPAERVRNVRSFSRDERRAGLRMDESGFATIKSRAARAQ